MSIRHGLLVLLAEGPDHGFALRAEFERRTGGTWPLNIGQVYSTLTRLVRDGLVVETSRQSDGSVIYDLTQDGRAEVERWWKAPVDRSAPSRDELAIKLALAVTSPGVDVGGVVRRQRGENLARMQQLTTLKRTVSSGGAGPSTDEGSLAWRLVLDHLIFTAEAEARWLDHVETSIAGRALARPAQQGEVAR